MSVPLSLERVSVRYRAQEAVHDVSLEVKAGTVVGLIGETSSGKSSLALAAARLLPSYASIDGAILLDGMDITRLSRNALRPHRGAKLGFVSQDAMAALNPVLTVGRQIGEVFEVHRGLGKKEARSRAAEALRMVRIPDPASVARLYPHQLSGGMRQRVMIAIALALQPSLVIADEPTTGLDVSVQAEILALVLDLKQRFGTSILWISHDMGVVAELADEVAVMYAGRIVEFSRAEEMFDAPRHPYTAALLQTVRDLRGGSPGQLLYQIEGQPPSLETRVPGCPFHPRCPRAKGMCSTVTPQPERLNDALVACHFPLPDTPTAVA